MALFRPVRVSVPGKVILMGEHAVVYGCPGLVTTVGARVTLDSWPADSPGLEISLPELGSDGPLSDGPVSDGPVSDGSMIAWRDVFARTEVARARFSSGKSGFPRGDAGETSDPASESERALRSAVEFLTIAVGETLQALEIAETVSIPGLRLEVRSQLPTGGGMGSSAAVAVAVATGLAASVGRVLDYDQIDDIGFEIESRQHGRPSGIDNASVLRGGVLWFERDADDLLIEPLELDKRSLAGFHLFHSGSPSDSTGQVVAAVRDLRQSDTRSFDRRLESMSRSCHELRRALLDGADPTTAIGAYQRDLEAIGVVPAELIRVVRQVEAAGGAAKISGAGSLSGPGAGALLVYHRDSSVLESLACLSGFERFRVPLAVEGARVEGSRRGAS